MYALCLFVCGNGMLSMLWYDVYVVSWFHAKNGVSQTYGKQRECNHPEIRKKLLDQNPAFNLIYYRIITGGWGLYILEHVMYTRNKAQFHTPQKLQGKESTTTYQATKI